MKRLFFLIAFSVCFFSAFSQQPRGEATLQRVTYSLDLVKADSFYLVETLEFGNDKSPRPDTKVNYQLFRSFEELNKYLDAVKVEADKAQAEALKMKNLSDVLMSRTKVISDLIPEAIEVLKKRELPSKEEANK